MALDELQDQKSFGAHWSRLEEPYGDVRWKKNAAHKFHVIYRSSSKNHFKFPGNFKPILGNESVVSLWRKRHCFFQNAHNAGAVFPRRVMYVMYEMYEMYVMNVMYVMCVMHVMYVMFCYVKLCYVL